MDKVSGNKKTSDPQTSLGKNEFCIANISYSLLILIYCKDLIITENIIIGSFKFFLTDIDSRPSKMPIAF